MKFFDGVSADDIMKMRKCFGSEPKNYRSGETITVLSSELSSIGLVLSGRAHLYCIDYDGNEQTIEYLKKDDVFGELFCLPVGTLEYIVEADKDCSILFVPYSTITSPCSNLCSCHIEVTRNLFLMAAKKSQELALRISFISRKSTRAKLMTYFEYMADITESNTFETHVSLSKLADYLCVDRTSLMRELRHLKEEGVIDSDRRKIKLLQ